MLYTKDIDPLVKNFRSLTDRTDHWWKKFDFWPIVSIHRLKIFFLPMTIDLIRLFCRQLIISIDPVNVFFHHRCPTMRFSTVWLNIFHNHLGYNVIEYIWQPSCAQRQCNGIYLTTIWWIMWWYIFDNHLVHNVEE